MKTNKFIFIDVLKALAALIIINSHLDPLYPIPALATGGAIGNAVFFAASGFLLFPIRQNAGEWMKKKLINIYIPVIPMTLLSIFTVKYGELTENNVFCVFIWPTIYWFAGAIILFYLIYYLLRGIVSNRNFVILFSVLVVVYFVYYFLLLDTSGWVVESSGLSSVEGVFKLIYYFIAMMLGKWFKLNINKAFPHKRIYLFNIMISFSAIYILKFLMSKIPVFYHFQFLNQFCILWLICAVFCYCISCEPALKEMMDGKKGVNAVMNFLGSHTLEMYLVQFIIIDFCRDLQFPFSVFMAIILIIGTSHLLYMYSNGMKKMLNRTKR